MLQTKKCTPFKIEAQETSHFLETITSLNGGKQNRFEKSCSMDKKKDPKWMNEGRTSKLKLDLPFKIKHEAKTSPWCDTHYWSELINAIRVFIVN